MCSLRFQLNEKYEYQNFGCRYMYRIEVKKGWRNLFQAYSLVENGDGLKVKAKISAVENI